MYERKMTTEKRPVQEIAFFCPRCRKIIEPGRGQILAEMHAMEFLGIAIDKKRVDNAKRNHMIAHYRHAHTEYEAEMKRLRDECDAKYRKLGFAERGFDFKVAWDSNILEEEYQRLYREFGEERCKPVWDLICIYEEKVKEVRRRYNKKAVKFLREDKLL